MAIQIGTRQFFHTLLRQEAEAMNVAWPEGYPSPDGWRGGGGQDYNPFSGAGFFATPMNLCKAMAQITFAGQGDMRGKTVHDPCCGTGSILLAATTACA